MAASTVVSLLAASSVSAAELGDTDDEGYVFRVSLPTQDDYTAWMEPGFRLSLGYGFGPYSHFEHDFNFKAHGINVRPHVRLSETWGVGATINYGISKGDKVNGLRWSTTCELTHYFFEQLALTAGVGLGGLWVTCPLDDYESPACRSYLELGSGRTSRALTNRERITDCEGDGIVGVARAEYLMVVGSNFASGPFVDGMLQRVRCEERTDLIEDSTGRALKVWEHWSHLGVNAGWWFTWR